MQKGKIIENIKFLIKQYEKDIENKNNEYLPEEIEDFENIIIELKFILELEGIDYENS